MNAQLSNWLGDFSFDLLPRDIARPKSQSEIRYDWITRREAELLKQYMADPLQLNYAFGCVFLSQDADLKAALYEHDHAEMGRLVDEAVKAELSAKAYADAQDEYDFPGE